MTFEFSINALIAFLRENNLEPEFQKATGQVFVVYNIQNHEVPVFFVLHPESKLLNIVAYLPYQVPASRCGEIARLLHILNKELDMPGLGMDEGDQLIFYRVVMPCPLGVIDKQLFTMYLGTTRIVCDTFMHAIGIIVSGTMSVDEVLNRAKDAT